MATHIWTLFKGRGKQRQILGNGLHVGNMKIIIWDEKHSFIMTWLCNSMILEISYTCLTFFIAQKILKSLK
jgi:hypothetical protein